MMVNERREMKATFAKFVLQMGLSFDDNNEIKRTDCLYRMAGFYYSVYLVNSDQ